MSATKQFRIVYSATDRSTGVVFIDAPDEYGARDFFDRAFPFPVWSIISIAMEPANPMRRVRAEDALSRSKMDTYRVIEQGNGFLDVVAGVDVYASESGDLLTVVQVTGTIHTDDPRGNYIRAQCKQSDRDVTSLTDREFAELPQVKLVRDGPGQEGAA